MNEQRIKGLIALMPIMILSTILLYCFPIILTSIIIILLSLGIVILTIYGIISLIVG